MAHSNHCRICSSWTTGVLEAPSRGGCGLYFSPSRRNSSMPVGWRYRPACHHEKKNERTRLVSSGNHSVARDSATLLFACPGFEPGIYAVASRFSTSRGDPTKKPPSAWASVRRLPRIFTTPRPRCSQQIPEWKVRAVCRWNMGLE